MQLEYSDAHSKVTLTIRKAPQVDNVGISFKLAATKLAVIVDLRGAAHGRDPGGEHFFDEGAKGRAEALNDYYPGSSWRGPDRVFGRDEGAWGSFLEGKDAHPDPPPLVQCD